MRLKAMKWYMKYEKVVGWVQDNDMIEQKYLHSKYNNTI